VLIAAVPVRLVELKAALSPAGFCSVVFDAAGVNRSFGLVTAQAPSASVVDSGVKTGLQGIVNILCQPQISRDVFE